MKKIGLEPSGAKQLRSGRTRYAIWHWHDADGLSLVTCAELAVLAAANGGGQTCADRPVATIKGRSAPTVARLLQRNGLMGDGNVLTEKGSVIGFHYRIRQGVRDGWETPHGYKVPF